MNYPEEEVPCTRIHAPRHLHPERRYTDTKPLIIREYPVTNPTYAPQYPNNDKCNSDIENRYKEKRSLYLHLITGGRKGDYRYYDMDKVIRNALTTYYARIWD